MIKELAKQSKDKQLDWFILELQRMLPIYGQLIVNFKAHSPRYLTYKDLFDIITVFLRNGQVESIYNKLSKKDLQKIYKSVLPDLKAVIKNGLPTKYGLPD